MFGGVARRVTGWYVFVATTLVVGVVGITIAIAALLFAHIQSEQLDAMGREVRDYDRRAHARHLAFGAAADEITARLARPGIVIRVFPPEPYAVGIPLRRGSRDLIFVSQRARGDRRRPDTVSTRRPEGDPVGFAVLNLLRIHPARETLLGGRVVIFPESRRLASVAWFSLLALACAGALAAIAAWLVGRYLTAQTIRPLVEVTAALQRFAGGDFAPRPIDAARGEFGALASAYNAASVQVAAAFAERRQAEERMRQFVADAGHELRTPLTIVLGYLEMLRRRGAEDERSARMFATIAAEGARMRTLVDNLVLLARLETGPRAAPEPFDLGALVEEVVDARRVVAPGVAFTLDREVEATVIGDRGELREALANLVDNALKHAPGSPVAIRIARAAEGITVLVRDRGPGIDLPDRDRIFERFYRGASRGEVEGSGLGLAIARRAAERAGGELELVETSPSGTVFALRLRTDELRAPRSAPRVPPSAAVVRG